MPNLTMRGLLAWCVWLAVLGIASGCSRALPFNFSFGNGELDLRAVADGGELVDLNAPPDQSINDLSVADLSVADLKVAADLQSKSDFATAPDLRFADLKPPPSQLGGPCVDNVDCANGAACLKSFKLNGDSYEFPGGYCSFPCNVTGTEAVCLSIAGHCRGQNDATICVRDCDDYCPTSRNVSSDTYGCCSSFSSGPEMLGCLPLSIQGTDVACIP